MTFKGGEITPKEFTEQMDGLFENIKSAQQRWFTKENKLQAEIEDLKKQVKKLENNLTDAIDDSITYSLRCGQLKREIEERDKPKSGVMVRYTYSGSNVIELHYEDSYVIIRLKRQNMDVAEILPFHVLLQLCQELREKVGV